MYLWRQAKQEGSDTGMKKILPYFLLLLMIVSFASVNVYAEDEIVYKTVEADRFPKTYTKTVAEEYAASGALRSVKALRSSPAKSNEVLFAERIVEGWQNFAEEIDVSGLGIDFELAKNIYPRVFYENPRLYYVVGDFGYLDNSGKTFIYPRYIDSLYVDPYADDPVIDRTKIPEVYETLAAIDEETENILFHINGNMSDFDKVMTVHDYIALNYEYDGTYTVYDTSMMVNKSGVCQAYVLTMKLIMDRLGIDCTFVSSAAMNHAWNLVKIDGEWYHMDCTWDDPRPNVYAQVCHTYALLSTDCIENLPNAHSGFDLGDAVADSYLYDNADWHEAVNALVYSYGEQYRISGTSLVTVSGRTIMTRLDGGDNRWNISQRYFYSNACYAGIAEYNGKIYFNTDKAIWSYDTETEETRLEYNVPYICGLFINKNTLNYGVYSFDTNSIVQGGSFDLGDVRFGETYIENGNTVTKVCTENGAEVNIFQAKKNNGKLTDFRGLQITENGIATASFPKNGAVKLFFWEGNFKPYKDALDFN